MLLGGRLQHRQAFAVEEHDRAEVDGELHVQVLCLYLPDLRADPHAGVVDEHVETAVAVAVGVDDLDDVGLVGDVRGDRLHVEPVRGKPGDGSVELLGASGRHGQGEPLFAEHPRSGQPDAGRCSCDDRCSLCHLLPLRSVTGIDAGARRRAASGEREHSTSRW